MAWRTASKRTIILTPTITFSGPKKPRPQKGPIEAKMRYSKYHALGNDYIVIRATQLRSELVPDVIRLICHRNYGVGSDGILLGPLNSKTCDFGLRIFNFEFQNINSIRYAPCALRNSESCMNTL